MSEGKLRSREASGLFLGPQGRAGRGRGRGWKQVVSLSIKDSFLYLTSDVINIFKFTYPPGLSKERSPEEIG